MNARISALLATLLVAVAPLAGAATNVAQGANVAIDGPGFGLSAGWPGATPIDASTVTDGAFVADGQQWNEGTVYWQGGAPDTADTITVTLGGAASITSLQLQGDNNDFYAVSYEDTGGTWHSLATFSPHTALDPATYGSTTVNWGMGTDSASFSAITATAFMIQASGGDNSYAVSEFQANGVFLPAVPEPTSGLLMLVGLGALASIARRRSAR
jgi:hypothetical protein